VKIFLFVNNAGAKLQTKKRYGKMESFSANNARSLIGRNVNLHLKDGAVIINVQLTKLFKGVGKNHNQIEYSLNGNRKAARVPLKNIAWAEMLNLSLMENTA
jgi:hypothetical protein